MRQSQACQARLTQHMATREHSTHCILLRACHWLRFPLFSCSNAFYTLNEWSTRVDHKHQKQHWRHFCEITRHFALHLSDTSQRVLGRACSRQEYQETQTSYQFGPPMDPVPFHFSGEQCTVVYIEHMTSRKVALIYLQSITFSMASKCTTGECCSQAMSHGRMA